MRFRGVGLGFTFRVYRSKFKVVRVSWLLGIRESYGFVVKEFIPG